MVASFFTLDCSAELSNSSMTNLTNMNATSSESDDFLDGEYVWMIGIACTILSSCATAVGSLMQKQAHNINDKLPEEKKAKEFGGLLMSKRWLAAFMLMVTVPLPFDFVALALTAQSVIVPFSGLTIVLNQLLAPYMVGETLTFIEIVATAVIIVGVLMTTVAGMGDQPEYNVCQLMERYTELDFLIPLASVLGVTLFTMWLIYKAPRWHFLEHWRPLMYCVCAAGISCWMNIVFKAIGELAKGSGDSWSTIYPYLHIVLVIAMAVSVISFINQGLRQFDAVVFLPMYNCCYVVFGSSMGAVYYKEFQNFETWKWVVYPLGLFIVVVGISLMSLVGYHTEEEIELERIASEKWGKSPIVPSAKIEDDQEEEEPQFEAQP